MTIHRIPPTPVKTWHDFLGFWLGSTAYLPPWGPKLILSRMFSKLLPCNYTTELVTSQHREGIVVRSPEARYSNFEGNADKNNQ